MASDTDAFEVVLNGEPHTVAGSAQLTTVIDQLKLRRGRVAVEINQVVIPKANWNDIILRPGDMVEIVNFVGGG